MNIKKFFTKNKSVCFFLSLFIPATHAVADSIQVTAEGAGVLNTTSTFTSAGLIDFNGFSNGTALNASNYQSFTPLPNTALISSLSVDIQNFNVEDAGDYGGAGNIGRYTSTGGISTVTLSQNINHFGIWVSAMDTTNIIKIYKDSTLLNTFTTQSIYTLVGDCSGENAYCGNPSRSGAASGQIFAFINFYNLTGTFNKVTIESSNGDGFESDNWTFGNFSTVTGLSVGDNIYATLRAADTQTSIALSANRLKSIYNLQSSALVNGLSYDCQLFDLNNICLSTGGRYSNNHGASGYTTSALLIGAYRLNKNIRLGAWVDQNISTNTATGVNLGNSKPLFGVFGAWAENPTGEGYEVKISAGYGDKDLTVTRDVIGLSDAGVGTSRLNSQAISTVSSYGFRINNQSLASPYIGIRYSRIASNGYTESAADISAPLTYSKLTQENVALMAGLRLSVKLDPKTTFVASAGVEQNLKNHSDQYSATGVDGLTSIEFNSNPQKTRATASVGAFYDIDKKQRVSVNGLYREETFNPTATTAVLATYTVGF